MTATTARPTPWRLIVPVKGAPDAKARLRVEPGITRVDLARAMAQDTIEAALAAPGVGLVLVVTSDPEVAASAEAAGARVVADVAAADRLDAADTLDAADRLNAAVRRGRDVLAAEGPGRLAVLLADLPALRPDDLGRALDACSRSDSAYVPDAEGTGTVLLAAARPDLLEPAFGAGSAGRHDLVAHRLELDLPRLRRDVDLAQALETVRALGVGRRP